MASLAVATGGMRLGIRMARPKCLAVNGMTALSMAPSRTCRCQSSGLRMVMRVVISPDRCRGGGEGFPRRLVDHRAGEVGDAGKAAFCTPLLQALDDGDQARRIAEDEIADHDRAGAGQQVFDDVLDLDDAAAADD